MIKQLTVLVTIAISSASAICFATESDQALATRIDAQLQSNGLDQYEAAKDPGRKPVECVRFSGVKA